MEHSDEDAKKVVLYFRLAAFAAVGILSIGTVFYHIVEKLQWLDSIYFSTVTLTTVGYGDITPHTNAGKLFTIGYILCGIGILATFANLAIKRAFIARQNKR